MSFSSSSQQLFELTKNFIFSTANFESKKQTSNNNLLLTGASGFLGIHLLKQIVLSNRFNQIFVIVRDKNKLHKQAKHFNLSTNWLDNVICIESDLLLLDETQFPDVQFIIHSAAQIHCLKKLTQLWRDNVLSTLKLSQIYKNNKLLLISSLSVFVSSNLRGNHAPLPLPINDNYFLYGGYAQSKFCAEKIAEHFNHSIFRPGLITASTTSAIFPNDFFSNFIKNSKTIGTYPILYEKSFVDMTPVDFCVNEILMALSTLQNKNNSLQFQSSQQQNFDFSMPHIFHCANPQSISINHFIDALNLIPVPNEKWESLLDRLPSLDSTILKFAYFKTKQLKDNFNYFNLDLFQSTGHFFGIKKTVPFDNQKILTFYCSPPSSS